MIFYFSGTGNSRWVAEVLNGALAEPLIPVVEAFKQGKGDFTYSLNKEEKVIFVFPVHSWGPAVLMLRFIACLRLKNYNCQSVYFVCTCGDDCGRTDRIMRKALEARGIALTAGFSIQMPNTYVLLPGFDVDSDQLEAEKLGKAPSRIQQIITCIEQGKQSDLYYAGDFPSLKSMVYPIFTHWIIGKTKFYASDSCVSCGKCADVCPTGTISLADDGKPRWKDTCVQCMACYHRCPVHAIEYGKATVRKGHYHHPDLKGSINL